MNYLLIGFIILVKSKKPFYHFFSLYFLSFSDNSNSDVSYSASYGTYSFIDEDCNGVVTGSNCNMVQIQGGAIMVGYGSSN